MKRTHWPPDGSDEARLVSLLEDVAGIIKRMHFPANGAPADARSGMPEIVRDWHGYGWTELSPTPERPTKKELDLAGLIIPWLYVIDQPKIRKVVFAKALGMGYRKAGGEIGMSHQTAAYLHRHGINHILCAVKKDLTKSAIFDRLTGKLDAA